MLQNHARVIINRVSHLAADSHEATNANSRSLLANLATFQISHQYLFKLSNSVVMNINELVEVPHTAADMDGSGRIWNLHGIKDGLDALIRLKVLRDTHDDQGAGIEGLGVFRGAEELFTKAHHGGPVKPNYDYNDSGDNINHADMRPEVIS